MSGYYSKFVLACAGYQRAGRWQSLPRELQHPWLAAPWISQLSPHQEPLHPLRIPAAPGKDGSSLLKALMWASACVSLQ